MKQFIYNMSRQKMRKFPQKKTKKKLDVQYTRTDSLYRDDADGIEFSF